MIRFNFRKRKAETQQPDPPEPKKVRKSCAENSRAYRQRIKEDPDYYKTFREHENARVKSYLARLPKNKQEHYREMSRKCVQKYRAEKKARGELTYTPKTAPKTRSEKEAMRKKWRERKAAQRASLSSQARRRLNEKRRQKYAEENVKNKKGTE